MKIAHHAVADYAATLPALLPPGLAWQWPAGGFGEALLLATGAELARVESATQAVLDNAIETHRPGSGTWHLSAYQAVVDELLAGFPGAPAAVLDVPFRPMVAGKVVGDSVWSYGARFIIRATFAGVLAPEQRAAVAAAFDEFKQAHVMIWFEE